MRRSTVRAAFAAILVGACLSIEATAKLFTVYSLGIDQSNYKRFYLDNPDYEVVMWSRKYEPHPYVGYVRPEKLRQLEQFRDERDPHEYVIAILGGSVADDFADYVNGNPDDFEKLRPLIPTIGDRRIQFLNLAFGGHKQPQQFFMASYISPHADMTINIEGFNEMAITDLYPVYPTDFPATTVRMFSREEGLNIFKVLAESLTLAYRVLHRTPVELPFVSRSSLYFLIWKVMHPQLYQGIDQLEQRYLESIDADLVLEQEQMQEGSWQRKIDIWRKYTRLQHQVAQAAGVAAYFFLQPNQYLKGSKPFSDEERAIAIRSEISEVRHAEMTLLREAALDMRAQRLPVFDLTQIYRHTLEPVYRDACCHVVELGNEIMAEQIVATISAMLSPTP